MAIEDVIHDLRVYFDSLQKPVEFRPQMAGMFNPSYLTVRYKDQEQVLTFWSVAGKSEAEKRLAVAFRDDIQAFITETDNAIEQERLESISTPEHQDRDSGGEATEAGSRDSPERPAAGKGRTRPAKEAKVSHA